MANPTGNEDIAARRRSSRVIRKPELFADDENANSILSSASNKRKRTSKVNGNAHLEDEENDLEELDGEVDSDAEDIDDDQPKEQTKRRKRGSGFDKPAAKRSRTTNGTSTTLAIRPANGIRKPLSKAAKAAKARSRPSAINAIGLYAIVFGQNNTADEAAGEWQELLQKDNVAGICDLVNFILECVSCESRINSSDVEDVDNVPSKLGDILEEYSHQTNTDYALSSKLKPSEGFKTILAEFFGAAIQALHNSGILYDEPAVYDNIHIWTATMSGASYRPFRHIATIVSLAMTTTLCQIAQGLQSSMATTKTQIEGEKKKKSTNKARISKLQDDMKRDETRLAQIDDLLRDVFDTVYVHRYRDVDERIRVECATALGSWILIYRKMFLEGQYLRYLGWVLSDPNAPTRLEVIRALKGLFKSRANVGALRAFTDRFRSRIVEMGSRDTDTTVRIEAIELLDRLRNAELLEPDDIDIIGRLIFDNEPRVRKAVSKFFVANIEDLYKASIEELDEEQYASTLPSIEDTDDFMEPCQSWIKFKCLAQTLASHDDESDAKSKLERDQDIYGTENATSKYLLAAQSIYPYMEDLQHWQSLAGYLLFDHSSISADVDTSDINSAVRAAYKLNNGEDTVLLDVLQCCVQLYLQQFINDAQADSKSKSKKAQAEAQSKQEATANNLILILPQLLSKFGSAPEAAASILRLEQLLNIDMISDLQSGEGSYMSILDDINKQFNSHNDRKVLTEASKAFRAARKYETSHDAVDTKVSEIWTESKESLHSLLQGKNISARGTIDRTTLRSIGDILNRLAQLAAVSDCAEVLESRLTTGASKKSKGRTATPDTLLDTLGQLVKRGVVDEDTTEQFSELEDRVTSSILTIFSFYFRWKIVGLKNAIEQKDTKELTTGLLTNLAMQRSNFVESIVPVISARQPLDHIRVISILTLLDTYTLFATVRHMRPNKGNLNEETQSNVSSLATNIPKELVNMVMETHERMEKRLARRSKKRIDLPGEGSKKKGKSNLRPDEEGNNNEDVEDVEKPPEDSEDEADNASDSDDGNDSSDEQSGDDQQSTGLRGREARKQAALLAEQALCELASKLVLASIAGVANQDGKIKSRFQVNRSRLGKSYSQVIAYLDDKKAKSSRKEDKTAATSKNNNGNTIAVQKENGAPAAVSSVRQKRGKSLQKHLSEALVIEDDDIEDDDNDGQGGDAAVAVGDQVEEGDAEDLRRRGLADDDDDDDDEDENENNEGEGSEGDGRGEQDDEVMGD